MAKVRFKQFLPRSIFGRSLLIVLIPMVILQVVMALVFYERHWETVTRRLAAGVAGDWHGVGQSRSAFSGRPLTGEAGHAMPDRCNTGICHNSPRVCFEMCLIAQDNQAGASPLG